MITKLTTLARPAILNEILRLGSARYSRTSSGTYDFYDIGAPLTQPLSPTGTILISLKRSYLERNRSSFLWGSIPDNGGIKSGFLPHLSPHFHKCARLTYEQFSAILDIIELLPPASKMSVFKKERSSLFCKLASGLIDDRVIGGMLEQSMQAARRIEFCLKGDCSLVASDIIKVLIPNTYKEILPVQNAVCEQNKIEWYNPRQSVSRRWTSPNL